ncbi:hypothetical protein QWN73_001761 [Escherichia coli]|nr:hypothetical protein [Escherichia coli]
MKLWPTLGVAFLLIAAWGASMRLSWSLGRENARNEAQASTLKSTVDTLNIISAGVIEPTQNMAISDIQAARCESFTISEGGRNE